MPFISDPDGDLKTAFVSDAFLLDQFVGNTLFNWGGNSYGSLGDNTTASKSNPSQTVTGGINWKQVTVGQNHIAAIKTDGTLWCWGSNNNGQLGDNTITHRSSPIQTIAFGNTWKQVSSCDSSTSAIKTDGTLWTWGQNFRGELGDNTTVIKSSPVQTVAGGTNWKQVSAGYWQKAAIKTDGTLWMWGYNFYGQLGDNTTTNRSSPVQTVTYGTNWKQADASRGWFFTAAIKNDGTLWTWGSNSYGQLGDNTIANKSSPVQTISFGTNWKQVSCGQSHTAAIKTDGTLWSWGRNSYGALGDNTIAHKSSPVQTISFGNNWKSVACGYFHTAAIKTDGTLWIWGYNASGQLGDNTTAHRSSPVQTSAYGTNWKQAACGSYVCTAAVTNGDI
jgi:alpha-tubulin suppressor-like RCC1 family protein